MNDPRINAIVWQISEMAKHKEEESIACSALSFHIIFLSFFLSLTFDAFLDVECVYLFSGTTRVSGLLHDYCVYVC